MDTESRGLGPFEPVPDVLILAAVQRAERHRTKNVSRHEIGAHLGFVQSAGTTRKLRPQLESPAGGRFART
jgi:hypothetical protein